MNRINKTILSFIIAASLLLASITLFSCEKKDEGEAVRLSFKESASYEYLKTLDGKRVTINGYMATSSPVDGSFIFLMNLPYQSCPFCVPNTNQLSNTMEAYPKKGEKFSFTNQAVKIVGTLEVTDSKDEFFTDKYGYEFNYKIVNASYTVISSDELSKDMALWQKIASSGLVDEMYKMYDYLNFVCKWNTYYVNSTEEHKGYYLWPADAMKYLTTDGAQWNYGYKDGYFDGLVSKIESLDKSALSSLVENVRKAKSLAEWAISDLKEGKYTFENKYVEMFDTYDDVYTLNNAAALEEEFARLYEEFSMWIASFEM